MLRYRRCCIVQTFYFRSTEDVYSQHAILELLKIYTFNILLYDNILYSPIMLRYKRCFKFY